MSTTSVILRQCFRNTPPEDRGVHSAVELIVLFANFSVKMGMSLLFLPNDNAYVLIHNAHCNL